MKNKTLFIGCGGSGIKTLQRINELLSGNPETRQIMRENISYMIFDLDVSETENFKENVRKQVGNAGMPFIKTVAVTRNITNLEEIVRPSFDEYQKRSENELLSEEDREKARKQLQRLKQNWWYSPAFNPDEPEGKPVPSHPFRAQNIVEGLNQGAGQCGPVSFLSAWNYLPNLKRDLQEVVEAIQIRNTDTQGVGLNVIIVAGTAGGTGRGCWQPIAFKVAQTLREMGFNVNPIGVFFDSSCFKNVVEGSPNERLNLSVNSLTAMSELSAWMMQPVIRTFQFALPNLKNPGADLIYPGSEPPVGFDEEAKTEWYAEKNLRPYTASTDVIAVPPDGDNELSPITTAYLVFGNNGIATLENNDQYHEMAAAALYAIVAQDEFIGPGAVNRHESVRSFGAITFEVPTIPIRRYMESMVRRQYSETLFMNAADRPRDKKDQKKELESAYILGDEADQLVGVKGGDYGDVEEKALPFFEKTKFCVDDPITTVAYIQPSYKNTTLIQRLMGKYAEDHLGWNPEGNKEDGFTYPGPTDSLREALESQSVEEAASAAQSLLSFEEFDEGEIETNLSTDEDLAKLKIDEENLKKLIQETVIESFAPETPASVATQLRMEASVGRAVAVLKKMEARIRASIANLGGSAVQINDSTAAKKVDECVAKFGDLLEAQGQKKFWQLKRFSKAKIDNICEEFQNYLTCALYFKIRKPLVIKFRKALEALNKVDESLTTLVDGLKKVGKYYNDEICKTCGVKGDLDKAYRQLFIDDDEESVFRALPKMDSTSNVYKRVLRPIMSREAVANLVKGNTDKNEKPIKECLNRFVRDLVRGEVYPTPEDAQDAIRAEFVELISSNVSLKYKENSDFMSRIFSFKNVLKNNVKYWNDLLKARVGSEDMVGEITDRLRKYLGVCDYEKDENGKRRIKFDTLWEDIVTSMAGDCKPWMELKESAHETYLNATALIPTDESELDAKALREHVKGKFQGKVLNVCLSDGKHGDMIPKDRIIVFSAMAVTVHDAENPFDSIHSLEYYKEADFSRLLCKAENKKEISAYFYPIKNNPAAKVKWGEQRDTHGFVSPIFVFEDGLASTRWRPWLPWDGGKNAALDKKEDVANALLFAFVGMDNNLPEELAAKLTEAGWKGPILMKGSKAESLVFARKNAKGPIAWEKGDVLGWTITDSRRYLAGEGRLKQQNQGSTFEKGKAEGNKWRKSILAEFDDFRKEVAPKLGANLLDEVIDGLGNWLYERFSNDTGSDKEIWEDLSNRVTAKKFKLS